MHDQLPALAGVAFLNSGTCGPMPRASLDAMLAEADFQVTTPRINKAAFEHIFEVRGRARAAAARAVGAQADEVALTNSTSQGVGTIVAAIDWREGDELVTTTEEHPGVTIPAAVAAARFGVKVVEVPAADVVAAITPRTRLVALSHVLWTTGTQLDLPAIAEAVHAVGGQLLADGAQSVGNVPVDVHASGADFYAFSGQKWLMGPSGSGGLFVHPRAVEGIHPPLPGYLSVVHDDSGDYTPGAARFDAGMIDTVTLSGFAAAMEYVEELPGGRERWIATAAANTAAAREQLSATDGLEVADGDSGLIAVKGALVRDPEEQVAALGERGVLVRSIPGTGYIRVSVGAWTTPDDIAAFIAGLQAGA